jgi:IS30 family transposase
MIAMLDLTPIQSLGDIATFLTAAEVFTLEPRCSRRERAQWIRSVLIQFSFRRRTRKEQGLLRRYLVTVTGYSAAQLTRHIRAYKDGKAVSTPFLRHHFPQRYTTADAELLATADNAHNRLNGRAMQQIFAEQYRKGDLHFVHLAGISPAQIYRLRQTRRYREEALTIEKTNPTQRAIGERRKPEPSGVPGFLRVDTVHQGDFGKEKGVYHINLVDEVTQWEVIVAVEQISEECVEPALAKAFGSFPFRIRNFHSDNGSEYINDVVHQFLVRWKAKQTKGRPRHSNDNGLAETKNGAVIRKHMGYRHIPQPYASRINVFYREHLIPYLNFHRPCAFPDVKVLPSGKKIVKYKEYKTPLQKFLSLKSPEQYLRDDITLADLQCQADEKLPNDAATEMQEAKRKLFQIILRGSSGTLSPFLIP